MLAASSVCIPTASLHTRCAMVSWTAHLGMMKTSVQFTNALTCYDVGVFAFIQMKYATGMFNVGRAKMSLSMCGAPKCPQGCECVGYSAICMHFLFDVTFKFVKILSLRVAQPMHQSKFKVFEQLLLLDLSYCNLTTIRASSVFSSLNLLLKLDLSHNQIGSIPDSFDGLAHLRHLDLSWNPLHLVTSKKFQNNSRTPP